MTSEEINTALYRPILSGDKYNGLFPSSACKTVKLAKGNTKVAITQMAKWAKKYVNHTKKIAPTFIANTLEETLNNIQWFLYWHINYKIDGTDQNLKSPACSWETRFDGTDCKSYSIFASTILLNLGINHFLRRIKQNDGSNAFTHVYVAIPINQSQKTLTKNAKFGKDYLIIDGTIEHNIELPFRDKDDIYMETKLPIYGLAAPHRGMGCSCGCNNYQSPDIVPMVTPDVMPVVAMAGLGSDRVTQIPINGITKGFNLPTLENTTYNQLPIGTNSGFDPLNPVNSLISLIPGGDIINSVVPVGEILGNITKYAGDMFSTSLSCYKSTHTPSQTETSINNVLMPFITNELSLVDSNNPELALVQLETIMKYAKGGYSGVEGALTESKWKKCSRESLKMFSKWWNKTFNEVKAKRDKLVSQMKAAGYVLDSKTQSFDSRTWDVGDKPNTYEGDIGLNVYGAKYDNTGFETFNMKTYSIKYAPENTSISLDGSTPDIVSSYVDTNGELVFLDANNQKVNTKKPKTQQAGFGLMGGIVITAIIVGAVVLNKNDKPKE